MSGDKNLNFELIWVMLAGVAVPNKNLKEALSRIDESIAAIDESHKKIIKHLTIEADKQHFELPQMKIGADLRHLDLLYTEITIDRRNLDTLIAQNSSNQTEPKADDDIKNLLEKINEYQAFKMSCLQKYGKPRLLEYFHP